MPAEPSRARDRASTSAQVTRACDQCNRKRIKCDSRRPCDKCGDRICTFDRPLMRKGPEPGKPRVVRRARTEQGTTAQPQQQQQQGDGSMESPESTSRLSAITADYNNSPTTSISPPTSSAEADLLGMLGMAGTNSGVLGTSQRTSASPLGPNALNMDQPSAEPDLSEPWDPFGRNGFTFDIASWFVPPLAVQDPTTFGLAQELSESAPIVGSQLQFDPTLFDSVAGPSVFNASGLPETPAAGTSLIDPTLLETVVLPKINMFYERLDYIATILPKSYTMQRAARGDHQTSPDFACLLLAMSGIVLIHSVEAGEAFEWERSTGQARKLIDLACRLKGSPECGQNVGVDAVLSSFLLYLCFFGMGLHDAAWFRMRETLALAEIMLFQASQLEGTADEVEPVEAIRRQRLIGILAATERGYALQRPQAQFRWRHEGTLKLSEGLNQERAVFGLQCLLRIFTLMDERIINCYNGGKQHDTATCSLTPQRVIQLQRDLDKAYGPMGSDLLQNCVRSEAGTLTEGQRADLLVNQQWLKIRAWQLGLSHGFVGMEENGVPIWELSGLYPVAIGNATLMSCHSLYMKSAEYNGLAWAEKLWDIGHAIAELHTLDPGLLDKPVPPTPTTSSETRSHVMPGRETLQQLLAQITIFRGGQNPFVQKLRDDIARIS